MPLHYQRNNTLHASTKDFDTLLSGRYVIVEAPRTSRLPSFNIAAETDFSAAIDDPPLGKWDFPSLDKIIPHARGESTKRLHLSAEGPNLFHQEVPIYLMSTNSLRNCTISLSNCISLSNSATRPRALTESAASFCIAYFATCTSTIMRLLKLPLIMEVHY